MDIPLPEESQPPGQFAPECDNIPLPSCGIQFNTTVLPPQLPQSLEPVMPAVLPTEEPPPLPPEDFEGNFDQADDPNRYSPSRAIADDDIPTSPPPPLPKPDTPVNRSNLPGTKTTVLGKAQAKKRLLAFSMTKQGGGAGLSFGFQKKLTPKVNAGSAKLFSGTVNEDEGVQDSKDAIVKQEKQALQIKKKPSKKGSTREDKARAVVSAIEEIKREELMLRGVMCGYEFKTIGEMTAPLPLLPHPLQLAVRRREEQDLSVNPLLEQRKGAAESLLDSVLAHNDKTSSNDRGEGHSDAEGDTSKSDRHDGRKRDDRKRDSERGSGSRHRSGDRRRSKERHSRSGKDRHKDERKSHAPTELPTSWAHFRAGGYRMEEIRRLKLKLDDVYLGSSSSSSRNRERHRRRSRERDRDRRSRSHEERKHRKSPAHDSDRDRKTEEDLDHLYRPFDGPSHLRFPLLITNSKQMVVKYPRSFVRYTKCRPSISYCEQPESLSAHYRSRAEIMTDATPEIVELMNEIINYRNQEEQIEVKHEPGENLSSSLAALQVSYDEAEVGSPTSQENLVDNRRKERLWFPENDCLLSTEIEEKVESLMNEAENVLKIEKEDLELEREMLPERKQSVEAVDMENDNHTLSNVEHIEEKSPEINSPDTAPNVLKAERTTVRSKWDSDYEEDMMSAEENQIVADNEPVNPEVSNKQEDLEFVTEERQNLSREEYERGSETQEENQLVHDEDSQRDDTNDMTVLSEEDKDVRRDEEEDENDNFPVNEYSVQVEEVNTVNIAPVESSNEGNADQKLVSEYEEFMKAVSFDTVHPDEKAEESAPHEENAEIEKEPSERDIFERCELDIQLNNAWDEDSKERMEMKDENEEISERVNSELMLLEKVIRDGRKSSSKKKKKHASRSSSSSSEDEDIVKVRKHDKKRKSKSSDKGKKESRRKSLTSDGSSSSDESSSSSSEDEREKKKRISKKEKVRKKLEEANEIQNSEVIRKNKAKYKKTSKKKKKRKKTHKKKQRKRSKKRKVESSSSSEDSSDSDDDSSSSKSDKEYKHHKNKESKSRRRDDDSSSEDSSSCSSTSSSSSSSSSSHGRSSKKKRRKSSRKTKKDIKKRKKDKIKKKKRLHRDSSSDADASSKIKPSKLNHKDDMKLGNGTGAIMFDELQEEMEKRKYEIERDIENSNGSFSEDRRRIKANLSKEEEEVNDSGDGRNSAKSADLGGSEINYSVEHCWEDIERTKHKRKKFDEKNDSEDDDEISGAVSSMKRDSEDNRNRDVEEGKILKKRRRERPSHSSSPQNDLNRKRRRSPSTSPEHSPTPQRRSSTETKDKTRKDSSSASRNQTDSRHHLNRSSGEGHRRAHNQDNVEFDPEHYHSEVKDKSFSEEGYQSGFESCTDDSYRAHSKSNVERNKHGDFRTLKDFPSSDEDNVKRRNSTKSPTSQSEEDRPHSKDSEVSEDENYSLLLSEVKQEVLSEDEALVNQNSDNLTHDDNLRTSQNNIGSENSSKLLNMTEIQDSKRHFEFSNIDGELVVKSEKDVNETVEQEESGSIYSPGDLFDGIDSDDAGKRNIADYLDSSSQNSDAGLKSYKSDMSIESVSSPPGSAADSLIADNSQDSRGLSPSSFSNMKVIDQWTGYDSPSQEKPSKFDPILSLENIPLPPSHSENSESKKDLAEHENSDKSSESCQPPFPAAAPINSSISEEVNAQPSVSNNENKIFTSPLLDPAGQRKSNKITLQKHSITVKLLSPLARIQGASDNSKVESANLSNIFEDIKDINKEEKVNVTAPKTSDEPSKSDEIVKKDEDAKVQIKHPWKAIGIPMTSDNTNATLYDDLVETNVTEQQVSSTTIKPIPVLNTSEKSNSGEAVAKERVRKRPSRWGMITPLKSAVDDLQQDTAITSQQKPEDSQQNALSDFDKSTNKHNQSGDASLSGFSSFHRRKSSSESGVETSSSHSESRRRDSNENDSNKISGDRHSADRKDLQERRKDEKMIRKKSEDGDTRQDSSENIEYESMRKDELAADRSWERDSCTNVEKDRNNISTIETTQDKSCEQYRQATETKGEFHDGNSLIEAHQPCDWQGEGTSHENKSHVRSDAAWEDNQDYSVSKPNPVAETPWESRVVHYRSRSRSLSPEGWEESALKKEREEWREKYFGDIKYSQDRQDMERHDTIIDNEIRDSSRERDRIRHSNRDHERKSDSNRERMRGDSREKMRDHDRLPREQDRSRDRERDRMRDSSRDRDRIRDHDRYRDSGRERVRDSRDRGRDGSRDHDRIRDRQDDRERRDDRRIRDRWNDDIDRSRERDRDRRSERRWDRDRRDRKKDDRSRDHDRDRIRWTERSRSPLHEDRREHENTAPGYYIPDIPLPMASGGDSWGPSSGVGSGEADMELSCSPASSPLVGFKRSLADSTISDSELVAAAGKQEEHHPSSPFQHHSGYYNVEHYPQAPYTPQEECNTPRTLSPAFSPKRISLDDRIELELGVKKSPPPLPPGPQQIPVYHQQTYTASYSGYQSSTYYPMAQPQAHYENNEKVTPEQPHYMHPPEEFMGPPQHQHNKQFVGNPPAVPSKRRPPLLPTPGITPDMTQWDSPEAFIGLQDGHKMAAAPSLHPHGQQIMGPSEGYVVPQQMGGNSQVVQVGNVLQVVPADLPPGSVVGSLPPPPPPTQQSPHKSMVLQTGNVLQVIPSDNLPVPSASDSRGSQVFQVGNVLQVVPGASPSPTLPSPQHAVTNVVVPPLPPATPQAHGTPELSSPIAKVSPSPRHALPMPPVPMSTSTEVFPARPPVAPTGYSPPASPFLVSEQHAPLPPVLPAEVAQESTQFLSSGESPKDEEERRREERERRRQEKEKRRREKEKRRQNKLKQAAADNLIKKALQQEGEHTDIDLEEMRLIEEAMQEVPECEDEAAIEMSQMTPVKKKRRPPVQVTPLPPAGKGILISPGFREKPISSENEERKSVKFADGVRPGEGTSPSAGEDLPSPPPPPRKLPKEKRFKKKKKKKIKVKIIRQINVEEDEEDDDISPPPPPPGSPPPPPMYPPGYTSGYPAGYVYPQPTTYTVLPGVPGAEGTATNPVPPAGSATVFTPLYHQHHHTTTTTHTTTVQFAPPPPPPLAPAPPPPPSPHVYSPVGKQRKAK